MVLYTHAMFLYISYFPDAIPYASDNMARLSGHGGPLSDRTSDTLVQWQQACKLPISSFIRTEECIF
jgi:hypothetical protein